MAAETQSWQAFLHKSPELKGTDGATITNEEPKTKNHEEDIDDMVRNLPVEIMP